MGKLVTNGAMLQCPFGTGPATLQIMRPGFQINNQGVANIQDFQPTTNIPHFIMCTTPTNPAVSAALGAPQACIPVIPAPWQPGSTVMTIDGFPALTSNSTCMCAYGGQISVTNSGQTAFDAT